jgi:MFS family permease
MEKSDFLEKLDSQSSLLITKENQNTSFIFVFTCIAAIGGFLFGYDTGVIGGANVWIDKEFDLTPLLLETVVSMAIAGAIVGSILAGIYSDRLGRKKTIIVADVFFMGGAVVMAIAPDVGILIVGRFIVGVGVGIAAMVVPMYLAEVSPP